MALIVGVAVAVFVLDRVTKAAIVAEHPGERDARDHRPYLRLSHVRNTGAAFGLAQDRTTLLSILSVFAVLAILYYYRSIAMTSPWIAGTLGMQLAGRSGTSPTGSRTATWSTSWTSASTPAPRFWAFNVADSSIVLGIVLVMLMLWWAERQRPAPA